MKGNTTGRPKLPRMSCNTSSLIPWSNRLFLPWSTKASPLSAPSTSATAISLELIASEFLATPHTSPQDFQYELRHYGAALLFSSYLYEQLGREALLAFAHSATGGLDSLADLLAELAPARADTFFADWALANRLLDRRPADGRYGYRLLEGANLSGAAFSARIQSLPTRVESALAPYATAYYEIALPAAAGETALALDWQFADGSQDGWLQLAQVVDGALAVQRFRAGDSAGSEFQATLHPAAEQAFLAISPLPENNGDSREPLSFTLLLRAAGSAPAASDYAEPLPLLVSIPAELGLDLSHLAEQSAPLSLALGVQSLIEAYAAKRNELYQARNWAAFAQIEQKARQLLAFGADVRRNGCRGGNEGSERNLRAAPAGHVAGGRGEPR